jgi:hypothetical protein
LERRSVVHVQQDIRKYESAEGSYQRQPAGQEEGAAKRDGHDRREIREAGKELQAEDAEECAEHNEGESDPKEEIFASVVGG